MITLGKQGSRDTFPRYGFGIDAYPLTGEIQFPGHTFAKRAAALDECQQEPCDVATGTWDY